MHSQEQNEHINQIKKFFIYQELKLITFSLFRLVHIGAMSGSSQPEAGASDPGGTVQKVSQRAERAGRTPEDSVSAAGPGVQKNTTQTYRTMKCVNKVEENVTNLILKNNKQN